ncbi:MAG: N-acetylmuramoyl-L-alanine amidase [Anaerovorax sp.]
MKVSVLSKVTDVWKIMILSLLIFMVFSLSRIPISYGGEIVEPTTAKIVVNSVPKSFEAYGIHDYNYFKLRDLAAVLKGDPKQFDVTWDAEKNVILLQKNQAYTGKDVTTGKGKIKIAQLNQAPVFIDGNQVSLVAYTIDGNNYFKLRDVMQALDICVDWNNETQTISIDTTKPYVAPKTLPLAGQLICVDPGHGTFTSRVQEPVYPNAKETKPGFVSGTAGSQYSEAQVNLQVAFLLKERLTEQGAKVMMTREGSVAPLSNVGRAQLANNAGANMVIRVHCDGSTTQSSSGMSVLVPSDKHVNGAMAKTSYAMGEMVLNNALKATGAANGGIVVREDLSGFNWSTVPTILIEMGFMTNPDEDQKLSTKEYQQKLANGISAGVVAYFEKNKSVTPPQKNISATGKRVDAYMAKNPGVSQDVALWRIKMNMDKPEFINAKVLTTEELKSLSVIVNKRYGVPDNYTPSDLVQMTPRVSMRSEAKTAFDTMAAAAKREGFQITPVSGFRTVQYQDGLYRRYLKSDTLANVETYSARAGFSEHHTGMAVDVTGSNNNMVNFGASKEANWVAQKAYKYGYIIRYLPDTSAITGYKSEPWHLRYVGVDIAGKMKTQGIKTLEEYVGRTS